jgi:hypothetical protein
MLAERRKIGHHLCVGLRRALWSFAICTGLASLTACATPGYWTD